MRAVAWVGSVLPSNGQFPNSGHFTTHMCTKFTTGTVLFLEHSKWFELRPVEHQKRISIVDGVTKGFSSLLLSSLELSDSKVYLKYEPASEPLHISVK